MIFNFIRLCLLTQTSQQYSRINTTEGWRDIGMFWWHVLPSTYLSIFSGSENSSVWFLWRNLSEDFKPNPNKRWKHIFHTHYKDTCVRFLFVFTDKKLSFSRFTHDGTAAKNDLKISNAYRINAPRGSVSDDRRFCTGAPSIRHRIDTWVNVRTACVVSTHNRSALWLDLGTTSKNTARLCWYLSRGLNMSPYGVIFLNILNQNDTREIKMILLIIVGTYNWFI